MPDHTDLPAGFDPDFDDTTWTEDWRYVAVAQVPPGLHPSGYQVVRDIMREAQVFDRWYRLAAPFECRLLYDPQGRLWMSTTPQEHIMMYNNACQTHGHVLVGGLGLGLFPQAAAQGAAGAATRFTVIEHSPVVRDIVAPTLYAALDVPVTITIGDIDTYLAGPVTDRYDTIFLDTWDTLDASYLPGINRLRNQAARHLAPGGTILLWGYAWMVRLYLAACQQALSVPPDARRAWLAAQEAESPHAVPLLQPVVDRFDGVTLADSDTLDAALDWCRQHITTTIP